MCIYCVTAFDTHQISSLMALPQWLSIAFSIADFVVQRVDRVGPVSFEPPEKQPPEKAASTVDAPEMESGVEEAPPAEVDRPQSSFGFQAGGGGQPSSGDTPTGGNDDDDNGDNGEEQFVDRAGGGGGPSPSGGDGGGGSGGNGDDGDSAQRARAGGNSDPTEDDDEDKPYESGDDDSEGRVQCSFRAMRPEDAPTRYEVEKARDNAGEERPA